MTISIELNRDEEDRLKAIARREGLELEDVVRKLVADHLPPAPLGEQSDTTVALFAHWDQEDRNMTAEEIAEENRTWEEFKTNINAERDRAGARRVF